LPTVTAPMLRSVASIITWLGNSPEPAVVESAIISNVTLLAPVSVCVFKHSGSALAPVVVKNTPTSPLLLLVL